MHHGKRTLGVLLAAGVSRRFGDGDKLTASLSGRPLVAWAAQALLGSGCDSYAAIVSSAAVSAVLPLDIATREIARGSALAQSFRAAIELAQTRDADRLLISLGDMPGIKSVTLRRLLDRPRSCACCTGARPCPPVMLRSTDFEAALMNASGDEGGRAFIAGLPRQDLIALDPDEARDIDTQTDLRNYVEKS